MKRYGAWFASAVFMMVLVTGTAMAQEPPGCCHSPLPQGDPDDTSSVTVVSVSRNLLRDQQLTRGEFIDRIASTLFLGKQVDMMLASTRTVTRSETSAGRGEGLVAVRETRYYRIPRAEVRSEELDALDQVYLTDGTSYVKVSFAAEESRAAQ